MPSPPPSQPAKRFRPHVPLDKRKRARQACLACRDGKKKCVSAATDQCRNCLLTGQRCIFRPISNPQKNRPAQDHNILDWEPAATKVSQSFRERFPALKLNAEHCLIIFKLFQETIQESQYESTAGTDDPAPVSIQAAASTGSSITLTDILPSTSHATFLNAVCNTVPPVHMESQNTQPPLDTIPPEETALLISAVLNQLPHYERAKSLVDVFFAVVESNWYYFDERGFRNLLSETYQSHGAGIPPKDCTTVCLIFVVLALGSTFEHLFASTGASLTDHGIPGRTFFLQATKLFTMVIAATSVESAICCLLMSIYLLSTEDLSQHRTYLALALNIAVGLSLHRGGTGTCASPKDRETSTRLFWTIYSIERHTSRILGLPTMLQFKDIAVALPERRQDLDADECHRVDRLIAFTKLTTTMDEILSAGSLEQSSTTFDWACSKLDSLKDSIPAHLLAADESSFRANAHLNIMYNLIWVTAGRGALLRLVRRRLRPRSTDANGEGDEMHVRTQEVTRKCISAATVVTGWMGQLRSRNLLARFSFTDIHTCSSAVIVLLLDSLLRPFDQDVSAIASGMDALRFMADGSELAMNALRLVECLQQGTFYTTGQTYQDARLDQELEITPTLSQNLVQGDQPVSFDGSTASSSTTTVAPLDIALFAEMESMFLEYSEQDLNLFGFDGFDPRSDLDFLM